MGSKFQSDIEKDLGLQFRLPTFSPRVMSTIILYDNLHLSGYISGSHQHIVLAKGKSVKRKGEYHHDSCIKYKTVGVQKEGYTFCTPITVHGQSEPRAPPHQARQGR